MRKSLVFVMVFVLAAGLYASNGTQIGTIGGRSTAMGSAFRGLADDWSAVFFNPAGLTQLGGKFTLGASLGTIMPRGSYKAANYSIYPHPALNTDEVDATDQNFLVPALGVFYKPTEKLVFGLGVYAPFGLGTEWDLMAVPYDYSKPIGPLNPDRLTKENEHYSDHQVITIQPTLAYQISDKLSLGLGASYIMGRMDIDQVVMAMNPLNAVVAPGMTQWQAVQYQLMMAAGLALPNLTSDQNRLPVENSLSGDGSAIGVNIGLLYKPTDKLSVGLSLRYCTDLALSGSIKQAFILPLDTTQLAILGMIPAAAFASEADPTGEYTKQNLMGPFSGMRQDAEWDVDADLPLPMTAGLGLAYKATPSLTLTADASWTNWASWDEIIVKSKDANQDDLAMKQEWKNTVEIGVGAEFMVTPCMSVLGGLYTVDTPSPESTISPTILDPARRWVLTGGLGYKKGKIGVNLTGEWVMFPEKELISNDYEYDPDTGAPENYAGIYNFKAYVITLATQIEL
ncbi:outer membrane protein transport protein [bacterium]|nr:outer membrane protein transport protein [bacterium]